MSVELFRAFGDPGREPGSPVGCERLRLVRFSYLGFDGASQTRSMALIDGVAMMMAPPTPEHQRIASNLERSSA